MQRGLLFGLLAAGLLAQDLPPGKIVDRVVCRKSERQSYALYLPSSYSPERKWPILYCLDPGARGRVPVERFAAAAEKYGYLVAGSNNSRNGPFAPIIQAIDAMVDDTHARFAIDDARIYAAGHSGGGMAALSWAENGRLAGAAACGSTQPPGNLPARSFRVFATAGTDDFAYYNMYAVSQELARRGVENRFRAFDGGHDWLPPATAEEALAFFDGRLPAEPAPESKEERSMAARYDQMSGQLFRADEPLRYALIQRYRKDAAKTSATTERTLARQVLEGAYISYLEDARDRMSRKDYATAARCWEINVLLRPANGTAWYSLAVAQAAAGNHRRAIEALEKAAANAFRDAARVEREPLLEPLRGERRYQAVLAAMRAGAQ